MVSSIWSILLIIGIILGVWVSISSNRWVGVWLGLELNLLCFIPFMVKNKKRGDIRVIYFLVQSCGSFVLLISGADLINYDLLSKLLISVALLLKVGAAPFHFWYVWVAKSLGWIEFAVLSTLQKVSPLVLLTLSDTGKLRGFGYLRILICGLTGGLGGINSLSFRKLLVYSSIGHLGWILIPIIRGRRFWVCYFFVYCVLLYLVVFTLLILGVFHLRQITKAFYIGGGGFFLLISIISLRGLPPLFGFLPKWGVFINCISNIDIICLLIIIISSVIRAYYYLRSRFMSSLTNLTRSLLISKFFGVIGWRGVILLNSLGLWWGAIYLY